MVMPISAPRFFGFKPKSLRVLDAQENKIEYTVF
jgi:hypothetical protein